ncbi:hypothetical protein HDU98_009225 [Podochytrium sp. JEL0797]|nr:hypothetical protein HDU98_009225 [Podochytrium sp. JEL0797]
MTSLTLPDNSYEFILGSSSKSRAYILNKHKIPFRVLVAPIDEKALGDRTKDDPKDLVLKIAQAKADALIASGKLPSSPAIVVCCDQVAVYDGKIREKPVGADEARLFLESYRSAPVETYGGVVVINTKTGKQARVVDMAKQHFKHIPDSVIDAMIAAGRVFECCGGFTIEDPLLVPYVGETEGVDGGADSIVETLKPAMSSDTLLEVTETHPTPEKISDLVRRLLDGCTVAADKDAFATGPSGKLAPPLLDCFEVCGVVEALVAAIALPLDPFPTETPPGSDSPLLMNEDAPALDSLRFLAPRAMNLAHSPPPTTVTPDERQRVIKAGQIIVCSMPRQNRLLEQHMERIVPSLMRVFEPGARGSFGDIL